MSVRAKLLLHTLSLITGFVLLGSFVFYQAMRSYVAHEERHDLEHARDAYEAHMALRRQRLVEVAFALAHSPDILALSREQPRPDLLEAVLARLADRAQQPRLALYLAASGGDVTVSTSAMRGFLAAQRVRDDLRHAAAGAREVLWGTSAGELALVALVPIEKQGLHGALAVAEAVDDHWAEDLRRVTARDVVVARGASLIASAFDTHVRPPRASAAVWLAPIDSAALDRAGACVDMEVDGQQRLAAYLPLHPAGGTVVLSRSVEELLRLMGRGFTWLALLGLGVLVLGLLLSLLLARRIAGPLQRLERAALALTKGDLEAHVAVESEDEIGRLAGAFNQMAKRVEALVADVHAKVAEADRANRAKDAFLASVTHELRTPLTSVRAYAELLLTYGQANRQDQEFLEIIRGESERLTGLIDDVIDLVHLEAERFEWRLERFDLRDLVQEARDVLADRLVFKQMGCSIVVPEEPVPYHGDRARLRQILVRLMVNAWKFTPAGSQIRVRMLRKGSRIELRIADQGQGIPDHEKEAIFQRFYQQGDGLTDKPAGTGLGLAITRQIVGAHGGVVYCTDAEGGGAEFVVELPELAPGSERPIDLQTRRVQVTAVAGLCPPPEVASTSGLR